MNSGKTEETVKLYDSLIKAITAKWLDFSSHLNFNNTVDLSLKISLFMEPINLYIRNQAPEVFNNGNKIFITLIYKGIVESKTHPEKTIIEAFEMLSNPPKKNNKVISKIDTPFKRAAFIGFILGCVISSIEFILIISESYSFGSALNKYFDAVVDDGYVYRQYPFAQFGFYLTVVSLLFSFLYDSTIGRLINWIRHG